jgi:hypothetical protein
MPYVRLTRVIRINAFGSHSFTLHMPVSAVIALNNATDKAQAPHFPECGI